MTEPLLLAIDFGTQSVRALVFDRRGKVVSSGSATIAEPAAPSPGFAQQDGSYLLERLGRACRSAMEGIDRGQLRAGSLTCLRASVLPVDADGKALHPVIMWPDQRRAAKLPRPGGIARWLSYTPVAGPMLQRFRHEAECNWFAQQQPELWKKTHKFLLLSGYLTYFLTGNFIDSTANQVGYLPFDFRHQRWANKRSWRWRLLEPLRPSQLPELVPPGHRLGVIQSRAATLTGIPEGLPLIASAADKAAEVLGSGITRTDTACLSFGTAATVNIQTTRHIGPATLLPAYPAAMPGRFQMETQVNRGFWLVRWFIEQFGQTESAQASNEGVKAEALIDRLLLQSPPGAHGLVAQPYWSGGLTWPGPEARGALVGFHNEHTRADVYRALIEGVLFALREGQQRLAKRAGSVTQSLVVAGGGARSDSIMQITANLFGLPARRNQVSEAAALGAATNAAVSIGLYADYESAINAMCHAGEQFEPETSAQRDYDALYHQSYSGLYARLQPLYRRLMANQR